MKASKGRFIGNLDLVDLGTVDEWEEEYHRIINPKYHRNRRNFNKTIPNVKPMNDPPIYIVPRKRTESYYNVPLQGIDPADVRYAEISKGYGMQQLSSFTLGPVVGKGLCIVNAAFSQQILPFHLQGGYFDPKRISFWNNPRKPTRHVEAITATEMLIDGEEVNTIDWLLDHQDEWIEEWYLWRKSIAVCSDGAFDWDQGQRPIAYMNGDEFVSFVEWKKECYIQPAYDLIPSTPAFQFLQEIRNRGIPLGLAHFMSKESIPVPPITRDRIRNLFDSNQHVCMPYCVAGCLLDVPIYANSD